jgi:hypothetical protein
MIVNRIALLTAGLLCFGFIGPDTPKPSAKKKQKPVVKAPANKPSAQLPANLSSNWTPYALDCPRLAAAMEKRFRSFDMVSGETVMEYKVPDPTSPGHTGNGHARMMEYFWSPKKFRLEYLAYGSLGSPQLEYLAYDPTGMFRLGSVVGSHGLKYKPSQGVFSSPSDAQLVESWPKNFFKFLYAAFAGGDATLGRYWAAINRGAGGYTVHTNARTIRMNGKPVLQYQFLAERPAHASRPASTVELIFHAGLALPTQINTTYGDLYEFHWATTWRPKATMPKSPMVIND